MTGQGFSPATLVSSIDKPDRHDITEILLKVVLNTITPLSHLPGENIGQTTILLVMNINTFKTDVVFICNFLMYLMAH